MEADRGVGMKVAVKLAHETRYLEHVEHIVIEPSNDKTLGAYWNSDDNHMKVSENSNGSVNE
jgi:hypothetical protein